MYRIESEPPRSVDTTFIRLIDSPDVAFARWTGQGVPALRCGRRFLHRDGP
jgi:hypothetical protein